MAENWLDVEGGEGWLILQNRKGKHHSLARIRAAPKLDQANKTERIQKTCLREVFNKKKYESMDLV